MQREKILVGNYQYIVDKYLYSESQVIYTNNFVILRGFSLYNNNILNNIIIDKDIYILDIYSYNELKRELLTKLIEKNNIDFNNLIGEITIDEILYILSEDNNDINNIDIKNIIIETIKKCKNTNINIDSIVFPIFNNNLNNNCNYSDIFTKYNDTMTILSFLQDKEAYKLYNKNNLLANIECDIIRIYHPMIKSDISSIVHIMNYMNNINFHYFCNRYDNIEYNSLDEIRIDNNIYSEYIEFKIPNISKLFDNNIYYKENLLNIKISDDNKNFIESKTINNTLYNFNLFLQPYIIDYDESLKTYIKTFLKNKIIGFESNYLNNEHSLNLFLYPYNEISEINNLYIMDNNLTLSTLCFTEDYKLNLSSKLGFDEFTGKLVIKNKFEYPKSYILKEHQNWFDIYKYYNNVSNEDYNILLNNYFDNIDSLKGQSLYLLLIYNDDLYIYDNYELKYIDDNYYFNINQKINNYTLNKILFNSNNIDKIYSLNNKSIDYVSINNITLNFNNNIYNSGKLFIFTTKESLNNYFNNIELNDSLTDNNFIGYQLIVSSDYKFNNIIYNNYYNIDLNKYISSGNTDLGFNIDINNIFNSWKELPNKLIAQVNFIDKFTGNILVGNYVIITKEWFKYIINKLNLYKLTTLYNKEKNMGKIIDLNNVDNVNFINNINVNINNKSDNNDNLSSNINKQNKVILYRPYFYRTQELQNVSIRKNIKQNIGINLADYMTKVESFKLSINDNIYVEIGRSDIYVIFNIDAKSLSISAGTYDIFNQDDEYISTGQYTIY